MNANSAVSIVLVHGGFVDGSGRRAVAADPAAEGRLLVLDRDKFHASFAADVPADVAAFMADSQVPWGLDALRGPVTDPSWRTKPSWYLVTTEDQMIPSGGAAFHVRAAGSTVVEVGASHSVYVSQPAAVADLVKQAVTAVAAQQ
jgi:pimeloyl-ACP methyl ester carboxylesterase